MWSVAIHDTQSGEFLSLVQPSGGAWGRGDVTSRQHTFPLRADGLTRSVRRDLFRPWDRVLVQRWTSADGTVTPVYAGLIDGTPTYDRATGLLTVSHIDLRSLTARRMLFGVGSYAPTGTTVCTNLSLRGIARRVIYLGFVYEYSSAWPVPVNLPAEEAGSVSRTYYHYEFQTVDQILSDIEKENGGPDVEFQPKYSSDYTLSWDVLIGTPYLTGPTFETNLASQSTPTGVTVAENAQKSATGIFTIGKGEEQDMRVGSFALDVSEGLSRDYAVSHKDVDNQTRLNSLAQADLGAVASPTVQWTMNVQARDVSPAALRVGSTISTFSKDDEWIDDGLTMHRVLAFTGDFTDTISLQLEVQ
ncbi:MAG: hypothetical protein ABWY57_16035 [Mycetocola sp.]